MATTLSKIEQLRKALRDAGRKGYGDGIDEGVDPAVTETSPTVRVMQEPQKIRYVTVHKATGNPVMHDLETGQTKELSFK